MRRQQPACEQELRFLFWRALLVKEKTKNQHRPDSQVNHYVCSIEDIIPIRNMLNVDKVDYATVYQAIKDIAGTTPYRDLAGDQSLLMVSASWTPERFRHRAVLRWLQRHARAGATVGGIDTGFG